MKNKLALIVLSAVVILFSSSCVLPQEGQASEQLLSIDIQNVVISAGYLDSSAAIDEYGRLWTWGANSRGQLGDGTTIDRHTPVHIMDDVVAVSIGATHTAAIKSDGGLWTWGHNIFGALGDGTTINRYSPIHVMDDVRFVLASTSYTMAIKSDGSLWVWGNNQGGSLGDGTFVNRYEPTHIMDDVVAVSSSGHTLALQNDGSLWVWGMNLSGELGIGYHSVAIVDTPILLKNNIMLP